MESRTYSNLLTAAEHEGSPITKSLSLAINGGNTVLERKSNWPFDHYQRTGYYPVEYGYWWTPFNTSCGKTQLTMMHATAICEDGSPFGADRMLRQAHRVAMRDVAHKRFVKATNK